MQDHPTNRAERQTSARILAIELNNRAWELIERQTRTLSEVIEMLDAAHGSRALWFLVCEHADSIERLRAHHVVACACARAHLGDQAIQAARMAVEFERAHERDHGGAVGHFDQAMTLVSMQLASLKLPGAPRVEPRRAAHGLDGDLAYNPPSRRTRRTVAAAPLAAVAFSADSANGARRGLSTWARPEHMGAA